MRKGLVVVCLFCRLGVLMFCLFGWVYFFHYLLIRSSGAASPLEDAPILMRDSSRSQTSCLYHRSNCEMPRFATAATMCWDACEAYDAPWRGISEGLSDPLGLRVWRDQAAARMTICWRTPKALGLCGLTNQIAWSQILAPSRNFPTGSCNNCDHTKKNITSSVPPVALTPTAALRGSSYPSFWLHTVPEVSPRVWQQQKEWLRDVSR